MLVVPYFQRVIFRPQWPLPLALIVGGCGLPVVFGDWQYAWSYGKVACRQCAAGGLRGNAISYL